ncbi:MAG TPA: YaiO family outer membrane beta-barrel protein [Gemmatimonadales bacterium]|nr:YaiO family outer membrane beta-barrel protein [Gemmatimonadales bacterium]
MIQVAVLAALLQATDTTRWFARLDLSAERHTRQLSSWSWTTAALGRRAGGSTVITEGLVAERFDRRDIGGSVDWYAPLGGSGYVNLRFQLAPGADVIARTDLSADLYRGIGGGWELSGGYRRMDYAADGVDLVALSAARYKGPWYWRGRLVVTPKAGAVSAAVSLLARRYGRTTDQLLELQAGGGKQIVTPGAGQVDLRRTLFAAARVQRPLGIWRETHVQLGATWTSDQGRPARYGLTLGLLRRW